MILYHGSREMVKSPEIRILRYSKDFYFGFYPPPGWYPIPLSSLLLLSKGFSQIHRNYSL